MIRRITDIMVTLLPEPDSPTMPSTSPLVTPIEMPSTARTTPSSVRNETFSPSMSRSFSATRYASLTRGSSQAYATSTMALASTTKNAP